jgi:hypothetical protein
VQEWDEEAYEDEATEEEELIKVQQEIDRLLQELEYNMRRQAAAQRSSKAAHQQRAA